MLFKVVLVCNVSVQGHLDLVVFSLHKS